MRSAFREELLWPPGRRELTLLALPDLGHDQELNTLIGKVRTLAKEYPATDRPLADEWLHVTVQAINHTLADPTVDEATRDRLVVELDEEFATIPAFTIMIGSVLAYGGGIMSDAHFDEPFSAMVEQVRGVVARVCGPKSIEHESRPAHMMMAMSRGELDGSPMQSRLRRIRPGLAPMTVDTVVLAEVVQDPGMCAYRWDVVHRFALPSQKLSAGAA